MAANVAILALLSGWALAGTPAGKAHDQPQGVRFTTTATTERIALPKLRGPATLTVDALMRRLRLTPSKQDRADALAAKLRTHVGALCPTVEVVAGAVELGCRSRRMEAQLTPEGAVTYLDINELRGLPWRPGSDAPPGYHYDPWKSGLGQSCPGRSPVVKGECAYKKGEQLEAALQFRASLETPGRQLASIRLGDLALATGDPLTAAGWYRRAGSFGVFGRVADTRLCELNGSCLDTTESVLKTFDTAGMPEPVRAELTIRAARAEAYAGRLSSAARILARQARDPHGMASVCREAGESLCRRLLLEAMREVTAAPPKTANATAKAATAAAPAKPGAPAVSAEEVERAAQVAEREARAYHEELLEAYLALPGWERGPLAYELAQAAAPLAMRLGAPAFAGNLLASLAPMVPDAQLGDHLLQAAETFLRGEDWARARLVAEYARSRLSAPKAGKRGERGEWGTALNSPRWQAVMRRLNERAEEEEVTPEVREAIEKELASTLEAIKEAHGAIGNAQDVIASARAAKAAAGKGAGEAKEKESAKPDGGDAAKAAAKKDDGRAVRGGAGGAPPPAEAGGHSKAEPKGGASRPAAAQAQAME